MNQYLLRIYFVCADHFARWCGSGIVHTSNALFFDWRNKRLNKRFCTLRSFYHNREDLLVCKVQWLFIETTGLPQHWESWVLENTSNFFGEHKDSFPSFGLSQNSEGCPTLGAHQVSFHPLGLELRTDLQVLSKLVMYGCWEIQIASSANKVMSHYRMRSQHPALTLYVSWFYMHGTEPKHEFIEEMVKCFSLTL